MVQVIHTTHADLVARAAKWLRNTKRCGVVVTEEYSTAFEIPDAIGWKSHQSYLVECKATRADFLSDLRKFHRRNSEYGMGDFRYYMTPPGIIKVEELPEHWGLLEVHPKFVRVVKDSRSVHRQKTALNERPLLYKILRNALEGKDG